MMHRYPGSRSFTSDYRHLFFGRDDEKEELFRLIVLNDLVVLFGESGSGKTSLLQAGVCPELGECHYMPVFIRLNNPAESPEAQVCTQLKEGGYLPADLPEDRSLWEYFSRFWYVDLGEVFKPVIVFDQFEELFTLYSPEQRAAFIAQFAAIVNRRPPAGLAPEAASLPQAKFVFSLRSDFLYLLDELSADIPAILRCRFQLRPLDTERAEAAITRPAAMPGKFASPEFGYSPEALEGILEALGRKGASSLGSSTAQQNTAQLGEIAAFQLQMVCQYLEAKVIQQKQAKGFQITPAFYGGAEGIEQIINEFYRAVLEKIPATEQESVQKLLARGLIRNGRRIMMEASAMREEYGVPQASLELLHAERLLKRETRKGELYYEISHDTLVEPVLESFKAIEEAELLAAQRAEAERLRLEAEERERELLEERLRAEESERLKNEALKGQKRARVRGYLAGLVAIIAIGLGIFALEKQRAAEKQTRSAYANDLAYKSQIALRDGDRTTAFRLAEFAHRYVDEDNPQVTSALVEALYYNEHPDSTYRLPWASTLEGHVSSVTSVCFSPDGRFLATGSCDKTAKIWDLQTGKTLMTLQGHTFCVTSVCFSPDGRRLATGDNKTAKIWDLQTRKALMTLEGHDDWVTSICFSPDGRRLATGSWEKTTKIWDLQSGKTIMTLDGHDDWVTSVCFSPDGRRLATVDHDDKTAKIWDLQSGKTMMILQGHSNAVTTVCFSPDGRRLVTGAEDKTAKIWDLQTAKALMTLHGHSNAVTSACFSPDGHHLATGADNKTAKIWDLQSGKTMITLQGHSNAVTSVCFSPDGHHLATGSRDKTAKIWGLQTIRTMMTLRGHSNAVTSVCLSPDGRRLATGSRDKTAKIWDLQSGKTMMILQGHSNAVTSVCFSPDGRRLATGAGDNTAKIWDLQSGKTMMNLQGHSNAVTSVCFSLDGRRLATGSFDNTAKIWDLQSGKTIMTLGGHDEGVISVCFSPDGHRLATVGLDDNTAKIWDLQSGKKIMTLDGHDEGVTSVCFSPDGHHLATGSWDKTAKIWDLQTAKALMALQGHSDPVTSVCFSPDGHHLATGSEDNTAKIWNLQTAKALMTLQGHGDPVTSVCFSPDGRRLVTGSNDKTAKTWEITAQGCLAAGRRIKRLAGLRLPQLTEYGLENLLDLKPNNEAILLASGNTWQIAAFADLYADKIVNSLPKKADYARAKRLYQACMAADVDKEYFKKKLADLEQVWKEKTE